MVKIVKLLTRAQGVSVFTNQVSSVSQSDGAIIPILYSRIVIIVHATGGLASYGGESTS
jgi:hypothetical protein